MNCKNVNIVGMAIHHPDNKISNDYFIKHFNKLGMEIDGLLKHLGREDRFQISKSEYETSLSLSVEASKKAIADANITPDMLDMIVFVSDYPEYLMPSNALMLHHILEAKNANTVYDLNGNCIGMLTALDQVSTYMQSKNSVRYALVTGAIMPSLFARDDDTVFYPTVGDGASALILKCSEEDIKRGLLGSKYHADSSMCEKILFPACGMSRMIDESTPAYLKKVQWIPHDVSYFSDEWKKLILSLLVDNHENINEVDHFLFSQFSKSDVYVTLDKLGVSHDKTTFIADKYGYMGCSSPIFALNDAVQAGKIQKGSKVVFCSVGSGYSMAALLYQF